MKQQFSFKILWVISRDELSLSLPLHSYTLSMQFHTSLQFLVINNSFLYSLRCVFLLGHVAFSYVFLWQRIAFIFPQKRGHMEAYNVAAHLFTYVFLIVRYSYENEIYLYVLIENRFNIKFITNLDTVL